MWNTVNDEVPPPEDESESEEEQDEQETEEEKRGAVALGPGIAVPPSGARVREQPVEPLAPPTSSSLEPPRSMRITAMFYRLR